MNLCLSETKICKNMSEQKEHFQTSELFGYYALGHVRLRDTGWRKGKLSLHPLGINLPPPAVITAKWHIGTTSDHRRDTKNKLCSWLCTYGQLVVIKKNLKRGGILFSDICDSCLRRNNDFNDYIINVIIFSRHQCETQLAQCQSTEHIDDLLDRRWRTKEEEDECLWGYKFLAYLCMNSVGAENQRDV